jgi:hypothetical protein
LLLSDLDEADDVEEEEASVGAVAEDFVVMRAISNDNDDIGEGGDPNNKQIASPSRHRK